MREQNRSGRAVLVCSLPFGAERWFVGRDGWTSPRKQTRAIGLIPYLGCEFLAAILKRVGTAVDIGGEMSNPCAAQAADLPFQIRTEILIQSTSSWDGTPYTSYPAGAPKSLSSRSLLLPTLR